MLITQFVDTYCTTKLLTKASRRSYQGITNTFITDTNVNDLGDITKEVLDQWRQTVLQRATPAIWNTYRRHLRAVMNYAIKSGIIDENPVLGITSATLPKKKKKTVSVHKLSSLLMWLGDPDNQEIQNGWFWAIVIKILFYTGMRRRQLVGLQWRNIDFERRLVKLSSSTSKTKRSWSIPMDGRIYDDLLFLRNKSQEIIVSPDMLSSHQVFCLPLFVTQEKRFVSGEINADFLTRKLRKIGKAFEMDLSPHRLRHTFGTQVAATAIQNSQHTGSISFSILPLQAMLGHTNVSTTLEYIETDVEQLRVVTEGLPTI